MVITFPRNSTGRAASTGATWMDIARGRAREMVGAALNKAGAPGAIRSGTIRDDVSGQEVSVHVGRLFVRLSLNGRDFYFNRLTGAFDGTGSGCA